MVRFWPVWCIQTCHWNWNWKFQFVRNENWNQATPKLNWNFGNNSAGFFSFSVLHTPLAYTLLYHCQPCKDGTSVKENISNLPSGRLRCKLKGYKRGKIPHEQGSEKKARKRFRIEIIVHNCIKKDPRPA